MATFPQWHRLYTVQLEDALRRHGSLVGIPYWDWTRRSASLPELLTAETVHLASGLDIDNPWLKAEIGFEGTYTERNPDPKLFEAGPHEYDSWFFNQSLLALEQEDYCDFEIQLEITHNAIHSWVGGDKEHSLGHLHYASYDPVFFIHHSNTDRLWALWQALQEYRGNNPNVVNCALEQMREPLKPFSFGAPYNLNPKTNQYSKPEDTFDYQGHFGYRYDDLEFVGMSLPRLNNYIKDAQSRDRVFAGFLLKGFYKSASVTFDIVDKDNVHYNGGYFTVLGGSAEMPWQFDRLFKYEITHQLASAGLRYDDEYTFEVNVKDIFGNEVTDHPIPNPSVFFQSGKGYSESITVTPNKVRRNLNSLSERDLQSIKAALRDFQQDTSADGWANLVSFHGAPARCDGADGSKQACCIHGMPTFPHWHRLFTLQFEQALRRHGSAIAVPYWDWTMPFTDLPALFTDETFYDVWQDEVVINPFVRGFVPSEDTYTVRDIQPEIYLTTPDQKHSAIFDLVLSALEQTDYCDFEVQFEVMHNAIHFLVGGLQTYALSSLEFSAYDPMFYTHHSFTDKIWAVWQELQKRRNLPYKKADCALNYMSSPMRPFHFDDINANSFTRAHAVPNTVFDYASLGYSYDDMTIGGLDIEGLEEAISGRQNHARVFAGFLLKGVKTSGSVVINLCLSGKGCSYAGRFNLLGGPTEMPWAFDRVFKYDITRPLEEADIHAEDVFDAVGTLFNLEVKIYDVEGRALSERDVMPQPTIIYQPAAGASEDISETSIAGIGVRKNVNSLTVSEIQSIRKALGKVMDDDGPNGFQNIASFHGLPAGCEHQGKPVACCQHGMANFPQWHRLFIKQFEDALTAQGSRIGIPYWDWTTAFTDLPTLVTEEEDNPFHHGITFDGHQTSRAPREQLFNDPEFGAESFFYRQTLLAFEQTDYCDFEVQYEVNHNAIHSWTGGRSPYGMSTLEYTAYDPLFLLHHSNVDRQFAIWQALQKFRGLPYNSANCAIHKLQEPMRPFSDESNINPITRENSKAVDAFNYERLNYQYDNLNFHGLSISELNDVLEKRKEKDRIFVEFMLHGIQAGADVVFKLCDKEGNCQFAGTFAVLGGAIEMTWSFDRLFKYDVTQVFNKMNLRIDDVYNFEVDIVRVDGTKLDSSLIKEPSVQFVPGVKAFYEKVAAKTVRRTENLIRKDISTLTVGEIENLRDALYKLQNDHGPNGYEAIAGFHGAPFRCPAEGSDTYACCAHGMPTFPHWHRLHTIQFEQALKDHGALVGIPYWDWTKQTAKGGLPSLVTDDQGFNPFSKYHISFVDADTERDVQAEIIRGEKASDTIQGYKRLFAMALMALEEDNFCDFEFSYEILHNEIHGLVGGKANYSMFSLDYSAFDPFFMILHSSLDRIWLIWQELQKLRHKPFNYAECGGRVLTEPLIPFSYPSINTNDFTRQHSKPSQLFDITDLGYEFDKLELNGFGVGKIHEAIVELNSQSRLYFGLTMAGNKHSGTVTIYFKDDSDEWSESGSFKVLGGEKEMPWAYERLYKYDITANFSQDPGQVKLVARDPQGNLLREAEFSPMLVQRPARSKYDTVQIDLSSPILSSKIVVKEGTRLKFIWTDSENAVDAVENLDSYSSFVRCNIPPFSFHAYPMGTSIPLKVGDYYFVANDPDRCRDGKRLMVHVEPR